jgi:tetratricopeptide (TPR) repeat protein
MKRTLGTTAVFVLLLTSFLAAQNPADEAYLKAMQISDSCQKVQALKAFLAQYAGQGSQYENYANAYICLEPCKTTPVQDAIQAGEKALTMSGIDANTKLALVATLPGLYIKANQFDKAKESAQRLIEAGKTAKGTDSARGDQLMGAGYYLIGQAAEKAKDYGGAAEAYIQAYGLLKAPQIAADLKKLGLSLYNAKNYEGAEKIFRQFYASAKDAESATILAQTLNNMGKSDEALAIYREAYAKKKTGELAQNIGILLNSKAKTNPALGKEAMAMFIEAHALYPSGSNQSTQCFQYAQSIFFHNGEGAKYNDLIAKIKEHNSAIEQYTKNFNERFGDKSPDELSGSEKNTMKKLQDAIEAEKEAIAKLQAEQKSYVDRFNQIVAQTKSKLGK